MNLVRAAQLVRISLRNFRRSHLQAALAIAAAIGGTGGVIVCTGYAASGRQKVFDQFRRMGTNTIVVTPQQSRSVGGRARTGSIVITLRDADYRAILRGVPNLAASSPMVATTMRIRAGDLTKSTTIIGCMPAWFVIRNWSPRTGSLFTAEDERSARRVVLLGATAARDLFGEADPTGRRISINRVPFTVGGVLTERGQGLDAADEDSQIYVPLETAMLRLMSIEYFQSILLQVDSWRSMDAVTQQVSALLSRRHRSFSFSGPDFQVQNQKALIETQLAAFGRLTFLLRWIAACTLSVASLGIFGVAWIGIGHRTREIGTCRAMGATAPDVLLQMFAEAILGPTIGCGAGVCLAWITLRFIDQRASQPFLFSRQAAAEVVFISVFLYSLAALGCSLRAVRIGPAVALRSE
jgi:putative ABC transport system permease protein